MSAPTRAVVRVKVARNAFTSPLLPVDEALDVAETLRKDVVDCGDGWWFVPFTGFDGRQVQIRAREVVAIEWVPDVPDRIGPPLAGAAAQTHTAGGALGTFTVQGGPKTQAEINEATAFLRRQTGIQR